MELSADLAEGGGVEHARLVEGAGPPHVDVGERAPGSAAVGCWTVFAI